MANSLKELRKRLKLTQDDFALVMNVRPRTISRWETGATEPMMTIPQFKHFLKILKEANIDLDELPDN